MNVKRIAYYAKIYFQIQIQDIKCKLSYRSDFIISVIGVLLTNLSGFLALWITFQNFPSIMGWNYHEILFMYGFSLLVITLVGMFFENNWQLRSYIYTGEFIKYCYRPINIFFYYMSEVFDIKGMSQLIFGGVILVYAWNGLGLGFSLFILFQLVIGIITASLFLAAIMNISAAVGFWVIGNGNALISLTFKIVGYAKYPTTIYNPIIRFILTFIMPIAFVSYYPSLPFLRPNEVPLLTYLSPVYGMFLFYISYKIWMKGALSYSGTGS